MKNATANELMNYAINLRHIGFTFFLGMQSWTGGVPKNIRINAKLIAVHQTSDIKLLKSVYEECLASVCSFNDFKEFFFKAIDGIKHRFLLIDRVKYPIQLRLNWNIIGDAKEMINSWVTEIHKEKDKEKNKIVNKKRKRDNNINNIYNFKKQK